MNFFLIEAKINLDLFCFLQLLVREFFLEIGK